MYLLTAVIAIIAYYSYRIYIFFKLPEEWSHLKSIKFFKRLYRMLTNPAPINIAYSKYTYPLMQDGMVVSYSIDKGACLFISNPTMLKEIMRNPDIFVKIPFVLSDGKLMKQHFGEQHVVSSNGETWKRMRRIMNPIFNQSWKPELFGECFNQVIKEWNKLEGKNILVHDQIQRMTLDVMGKAFFDFDFGAVKNPKSELYLLYHDIFSGLFKSIAYILFPKLDNIPFLKRYELHDKVAKYNKFVDNLIERRKTEILEGKANNDNLLTQFVQASIPSDEKEAVLTPRELRDNLKIFFIAGHDTTANTITATIYYLARYPEIQDKLRAEVVEIMGKSDEPLIPNNDQLKNMEYLNMIIKETIRSMTTAAVLDRRANKPFTFSNGVHVPAGKIVTIHLWGLFHSPEYYPDPDKFDPERFRDPNSEANKNWIPFLIGSRTCIGMSFSLMEQRVVLAMLVQAYTFKITPDNPDYEKLRLITFGFPRAKDFHVDLVRINQS